METRHETVAALGTAVKQLDGKGRVGGYLVSFGDPGRRDLHEQFFRKDCYFGPKSGDGADVMVHHGFPIAKGLEAFADRLLGTLTVKATDAGLWAEAVLDLADEYQRAVHELVGKGKLSWSSGSAGHMVKVDDQGGIYRWPIIEGSLTPSPAEWRSTNVVHPVRTFIAAIDAEARKVGEILSAKNRMSIATAIDLLQEVLDGAPQRTPTEGKSNTTNEETEMADENQENTEAKDASGIDAAITALEAALADVELTDDERATFAPRLEALLNAVAVPEATEEEEDTSTEETASTDTEEEDSEETEGKSVVLSNEQFKALFEERFGITVELGK